MQKWRGYSSSRFGVQIVDFGPTQGVWDGKLLYLSIKVSLSTVFKELYKKCPDTDHTEIFPKGQFKPEPHPY